MKKSVSVVLLLLVALFTVPALADSTSFKGTRTTAFLFDRSDLNNYIAGGYGALEEALSKIDTSRFRCSTEKLERDFLVTLSFSFKDQEEYEDRLEELLGYSPAIVYQSGQLFAFTEDFDSAELLNVVREYLESRGCLQELGFDELMWVENCILELNGKTYKTRNSFDIRQDIRPRYNDLSTYIPAYVKSGFGDAEIKLRPGFDFLETGSSQINWDLALTCATLSAQAYDTGAVQEQMETLGWSEMTVRPQLDGERAESKGPVLVFGYQRLEDETGGKNIFAMITKWGIGDLDTLPDTVAEMSSVLEKGCEGVKEELFEFMQEVTGKSVDQLAMEENYFLFTGHSFGGAVGNILSADNEILVLASEDRDNIYTYTFSSPRTCSASWWMDTSSQTNAFNFKDKDDPIIHILPYPDSITYGENIYFSANDLDASAFGNLFQNIKKSGVMDALKVKNFGSVLSHHAPGLSIVYVLQRGANEGYWPLQDMFSNFTS